MSTCPFMPDSRCFITPRHCNTCDWKRLHDKFNNIPEGGKNMRKPMTWGELEEILKDTPKDTPIYYDYGGTILPLAKGEVDVSDGAINLG